MRRNWAANKAVGKRSGRFANVGTINLGVLRALV
jgi:hypothetical protein